MKRLFVIVLCGALAIVLAIGCEARIEVAKERVKEKIDSLLGSMDVNSCVCKKKTIYHFDFYHSQELSCEATFHFHCPYKIGAICPRQ